MRPTRMARPLIAAAVSLLAAAFGASAANAACDDNVWGIASSGALYTFVPPTAAATRAAGNPTLNYGTIARGTYSGYIYAIGSTGKNDKLVAYKPATNTSATVGTFPNTSFLYASGFGPNGLAYAMSSSEVYSFTDAPTPIITKLGAPVTTSGPAITAFDSGDVAVDQNGNGWVVLSNNATGLSYLYEITFGAASTQLSQAAQITLGGKAYTTADLYSLAFGPVDAKLYASSGTNGTLYQINQATGALTSEGAQGFELTDFGSCSAQVTTTLAKTGPTKSGAGELLAYAITAANSSTSHVSETALTLSDTVPTGIAITSESCTVTGGAVCGTPAVAGQTVTVTISSLPINASATLNIHGRDTALAVGTTTNTATVATAFGTLATASAATSVVATLITKTVANITQNLPAGTSVNGNPGDTLEYVLSYTNLTNAPLTNYTLSDTIPASTSYVAASSVCVTVPAGATCTPGGPTAGVLTWAFTATPIAVGQTISVKYHVTIN